MDCAGFSCAISMCAKSSVTARLSRPVSATRASTLPVVESRVRARGSAGLYSMLTVMPCAWSATSP